MLFGGGVYLNGGNFTGAFKHCTALERAAE